MSWLKALAFLFVVGIGATAQPGTAPDLPAPPPLPPESAGRPLSVGDQLRNRYLKVNSELVNHLPESQLKQRVDALEKELADAVESDKRLAREQKAAEALEKARATLAEIAATYKGTTGGAQALQALDAMSVAAPVAARNGSDASAAARNSAAAAMKRRIRKPVEKQKLRLPDHDRRMLRFS